MSFPKHFIKFDKQVPVYYSGEEVKGNLIVQVTQTTFSIRAIKLDLEGNAVAYYGQKTRIKEEQLLIYQERYLFVSDNSSGFGNELLRIGSHTFPFRFQLPPTLSSTYSDAADSTITYYLQLTISQTKTKSSSLFTFPLDNSRQFPIHIISTINLNNPIYAAVKGVLIEKEKVTNFFGGGGLVGYKFGLFKRGFVPGEAVQFSAQLFNNSSKIVQTKLELQEASIFGPGPKYQNKLTINKATLLKVRGPVLGPYQSRVWNWTDDLRTETGEFFHASMIIPESCTVMDNCDIITIVHFLKIQMVVDGIFNMKFKDYIYIKVGTVPVTSTRANDRMSWALREIYLSNILLGDKIDFLKLK